MAILYRILPIARHSELSLGMMALFAFDAKSMVELHSEADLWNVAAQALSDNETLDDGFPKPAAEFLAYGAAFAPQGSEVEQLSIIVRLGSLSKQLYVFGDREFRLAGISSPRPFSRMPVTPENAFGGPGYGDNPLGKGYGEAKKNAAGGTSRPLPNIEYPDRLMTSPGEQPPPAGFWAVASAAPQRSSRLGNFDQRWLRQTWPNLPEDTDPTFFHAAPPDQRGSGYFSGDETFEITHMHPQHARLTGRLPGLRARCFINCRVPGGVEFAELETRAETVWLFPELECGIVLYRATAQIVDEDDVLHVMAEWESLSATSQPFAHYEQFFRHQLAGGAAESAPATPDDAPSAPALSPAVEAAVSMPPLAEPPAPEVPAFDPELQEIERMTAEMEVQTRELLARHGLTEADLKLPTAETKMPEASLEDIEAMLAKLEAETLALMKQHGLTEADVKLPQPELPTVSLSDVRAQIQEMEAKAKALLQQRGMTEQDVIDYFASRPETAHVAEMLRQPKPDTEKLFEELAELEVSLPPAAEPAVKAPPSPPSIPEVPQPDTPPPVERLTREQVIERHGHRASLADKDLSGLDLSGLDLREADFSGALLQGTNFTGSNLSAAKLIGASASGAVFAGAKLDSSDLGGADFTGGDFAAAQMNRANLAGAAFSDSRMTALKAVGCMAEKTSFENCDLQEADFSGACLNSARFGGARLGQANFTQAACGRAEFYGVDAGQANFEDSDLQASRADADSRFVEASFVRARLGRANWEGARLDGAILHHAVLDEADLSRVQARHASFLRASAKGTRFDKGVLQDADLTAVNLFKGSMRKTEVDGALLHFANLYGVDFEGTSPKPASFEGTNIDRTLLQLRAGKA